MSHHPAVTRPKISVVVPSHRGAAHLARSLGSLSRQTIGQQAFEVVVVLNGEPDASNTVIAEIRTAHPLLRLRVIETALASASAARNLGLAAARGDQVTFVDVDDEVTPRFLSALLAHAARGITPIGLVADVDPTRGRPDFDNYLTRRLLAAPDDVMEVTKVPSALGFVAGKLIPTAIARTASFCTELRSGEDLVYWFDVFSAAPFRLRIVRDDEDCVYLRHVVSNSVSRRSLTYEFGVSERLDVIDALWAREAEDPRVRSLRHALTRSQCRHINTYLQDHPDDLERVRTDIHARGLQDAVSWGEINRAMARDLAVLYAFLPFADTSAMVAARRIRARGVVLDVVSNTMSSIRAVEPSGDLVAREFLDQRTVLTSAVTAFGWSGVRSFTTAALNQIAEWETQKGPYRSVYSRTMWPASHVVAAILKLRRPDLRWIAEFSDPQVFNAYGERRRDRAEPDELWDELAAGLRAHGVEPPEDLEVPLMVELLACALADDVVFTNENQRAFMLGRLEDRALAASTAARSSVAHHPTLDPQFYDMADPDYAVDDAVLNIAYFGVFYATRGLTEVTDALQMLTPEDRARVRLHVFTANPAALAADLASAGLSDTVAANPYLGYLEFLAVTRVMDVLLVNDARTADHYDINPYLPSKWSDYAGSGSDVWSIVEDGSVLSTLPTAYTSRLGDAAGARDQIRRMIADHLPR